MAATNVLQPAITRRVQQAAIDLLGAIKDLQDCKWDAENKGISVASFDESTAQTVGQVIDFSQMQKLVDWAHDTVVSNGQPYREATAVKRS